MHLSHFTTFRPPIFWFAHPILMTSLRQWRQLSLLWHTVAKPLLGYCILEFNNLEEADRRKLYVDLIVNQRQSRLVDRISRCRRLLQLSFKSKCHLLKNSSSDSIWSVIFDLNETRVNIGLSPAYLCVLYGIWSCVPNYVILTKASQSAQRSWLSHYLRLLQQEMRNDNAHYRIITEWS